MNLAEYRKALQRAKRELSTALDGEAQVVGMDAAALVEQRVVSTGRKADGTTFSPYSTKKVPAYYYFGRSLNQSGERSIRDRARRREGVSYRDFRQYNGRNVNVKNFQFTGRMWQGFGVKNVTKLRLGVYRIELGGKTTYSERLLGFHNQRENTDLGEVSTREAQQVKAALIIRVQKILDKYV